MIDHVNVCHVLGCCLYTEILPSNEDLWGRLSVDIAKAERFHYWIHHTSQLRFPKNNIHCYSKQPTQTRENSPVQGL